MEWLVVLWREHARRTSTQVLSEYYVNVPFGTVTVRNPFKLAVEEQAASYAAAPRPRSVHRPRGRPRRNVVEA